MTSEKTKIELQNGESLFESNMNKIKLYESTAN